MIRGRRMSLAFALLGPALLILTLCPTQAQIGPRFGPNMPTGPRMPTPPVNPPGLPGGAPGSVPGGPAAGFGRPHIPTGPPTYEFSCSGCGKVVGSGTQMDKQQIAKCPHCGVTFNNTSSGMMQGMKERMDENRNRFHQPGTPLPGAGPQGPPPGQFPQNGNGFENNPPMQPNIEPPPPRQPDVPPPANPFNPPANPGKSSGTSWTLIVGGAFLLLLAVAGGGVMTIVLVTRSQTKMKPGRRSRR